MSEQCKEAERMDADSIDEDWESGSIPGFVEVPYPSHGRDGGDSEVARLRFAAELADITAREKAKNG